LLSKFSRRRATLESADPPEASSSCTCHQTFLHIATRRATLYPQLSVARENEPFWDNAYHLMWNVVESHGSPDDVIAAVEKGPP
jgi:hypothetical protein